MDDEALAPVIGTALIVAVMVAMSVAAVIVFKEFQRDGEVERVHFAGNVDDAGDSWHMVRGPGERVTQADIQWRGDPGAGYSLDGPATTASPSVPTDWAALGSAIPFQGGTVISFCGDGASVPGWQFSFRVTESGNLLSSYQQSDIAACLPP